MAILLGSISTVITNFYVRTRVDELNRHGTEIVRLIESDQLSLGSGELVDLVAAMSGTTVMVVGPSGEMLVCSGGMRTDDPAHIKAMEDVQIALSGKQSWSLTTNPFSSDPALSLAMPLQVAEKPAALVFLAPAGPIRQTIIAVERVLLILATVGIVIITILAFFLSRRVSRPLLHMAAAASEMVAGDFSRRIQTLSDDEVGQLGRNMNNLSEQLEQTLTALASERDQLASVLARERQLSDAQKEFVANVSHELRTPLTYLQGYTEAILDDMVEPEAERRYLQIILDETQRLRRLVADLLDLTVIESGQASIHPEHVPIGGLVNDVATSLRTIADTKGVRLVEPGPEAVGISVFVDPDRTKQVLVNLIDNAIRYSPDGSAVNVEVSQPDKVGQVWVTVVDSGPGMPAEALPHVWDRFYKADRARRRDSSGTGLGLAVARGIVEAQGGHVRVDSTPGVGTRFAFSVPASRVGRS